MSLGPGALVLDVQGMQSPAHRDRGIGRYIRQHAEALHRAAPDLIDRFLLNSRFTVPSTADELLGTGRVAFAADALDQPNRAWSIFHVMSPFEFDVPFSDIWPAPARDARLVVTLYDLIPQIYEDVYLADRAVRLRYTARLGLLRAADLVLAISEASRRDAIELLGLDPERVHSIGGGVGPEFAGTDQPVAQLVTVLRETMPTLREGFVLYPGGADFRKNMPGLIRAFGLLPESLRRGHQLVIVCRLPPGTEAQLRATAESAGVGRDELILPGFVDDETLVSLYQATHLVVFPSLYEGFGLPIAEAMACGAPVIASNTSALPELVQRTEATFDPDRETSIAEVLGRALQDDLLRDRLRADATAMRPQLGWEYVARRTLDALDAVPLASRRASRRARRPRLAVLSPYPPQFSGIAAYTRSLLPHLSERCDVHCFVDGPVASFDATGDEPWAMLSQASFPTMHALVDYDRVLYCMGNSHFHHFIVEHLRAIPGDVLVHDVRLTGYYTWEAQNGLEGVGLRAYRQYGDRLPAAILGAQVISPDDARDLGIWLLGEILDCARQVLVHSRFSSEIAELEASTIGSATPIVRVPFGFPHAESEAKATTVDGPIIASFGIVADVKRPVDIVQALPRVLEQFPRARLVFVGLAHEPTERAVRATARTLGIEDSVEITGPVAGDDYWAWLRRADVAVQLRSLSQGEASLTVAEAMTVGLPVVVSRLGWMGELPPDTVHHVEPAAGPQAIALALLDVLTDPDLRGNLAQRARAHAERNDMGAAATALYEAMFTPISSPLVEVELKGVS